MSSGARQLLHYAVETVDGTTPSPFARTVLPFVSTSLDQTASRENSNTIIDSRIAAQGTITSVEVVGDIETEFRYGTYDELLAGVACNDWSANSLTFGGTVYKSFSFLRGYDDVANFHTFAGTRVNSWALSIPETGMVMSTFGLMGKSRTPSATAPTGTITPPLLNPVLGSVSVGNILIDGESQVGTACISAFEFTWDNSTQVQRCLGNGLDIGALIPTSATGTGSFTMAWSVKAGQDYYERQFTNATIGLEISLMENPNAEGGNTNQYTLEIPQVEVTASLPSGGKDEILQATFEFNVVNEAPILTRKPYVTPPSP